MRKISRNYSIKRFQIPIHAGTKPYYLAVFLENLQFNVISNGRRNILKRPTRMIHPWKWRLWSVISGWWYDIESTYTQRHNRLLSWRRYSRNPVICESPISPTNEINMIFKGKYWLKYSCRNIEFFIFDYFSVRPFDSDVSSCHCANTHCCARN